MQIGTVEPLYPSEICVHLRLSAFICGSLDVPESEGMMNVKIGSAPDSWGVWFPSDPKQTPWQRYLDELLKSSTRR